MKLDIFIQWEKRNGYPPIYWRLPLTPFVFSKIPHTDKLSPLALINHYGNTLKGEICLYIYIYIYMWAGVCVYVGNYVCM